MDTISTSSSVKVAGQSSSRPAMARRVKRTSKSGKIGMFFLSVFLDLIGVATYVIPILGEGLDLLWAPFSAILLFFIYGKISGTVGAVLQFVEEMIPGTDFIPTFTIMWFYKYVIKKD